MTDSGRTFFKNEPVGTIEQLSDRSFQFHYEPDAKAISLTLPTGVAPYKSVDLFPFFDGLIPEGWLLNLATKNWKIDMRDRMALLLTTCQDCIGAAHILPSDAGEAATAEALSSSLSHDSSSSPATTRCMACLENLETGETLYHKRCARELFGFPSIPIVDVSLDHLEQLALLQINRRLTLTGVQKKLSLSAIAGEDHKTRLTVIGFEGGFILKPPCEYPEMPELEHLSMKLAELQGMRVAKCGLVFLAGGERAYITRRFDRMAKEKIQVEDFCQLSEKPTAQKYTGSTEGLGKIIDRFSNQPSDDKLTLFQMIVYSFWIGNTDMHLKNFSLWRDSESQSIRLSPCYDLLSTRMLISKKDDPEELALPVNGRKNNLRWSDFTAFGDNLKIPTKVQLAVRDRIMDLAAESASLVARSFLTEETADKFQGLLREHAVRLSN